ncbi:MAG: PqiC family protein [Syntrophales bacterium]|nr:PqiC family protein [Syntrophales bacterium]
MMKKFTAVMILCALAVLTVGCASTSTQLYTLSPMAKPVGEASILTITVGPVSLPAAVDRPQLVLSVAPNQVTADEFSRWASPLKTDIARVVAENLSLLLGSPYVSVFPQSVSVSPSYRVTIDVMRFESVPGETAKLSAIWSIRSTADGQSQGGRTASSEPVREKTYAALIAAHSRILAVLSGDIAAAIRTLAAASKKGSPEVAK